MTRPTGDERPCQRCIKRGLQDACHDGVRKKAKYLHDAPNDALLPGVGLRSVDGNQFQYVTNLARGHHLPPDQVFPGSSPNEVYVQQQGGPLPFGVYSSNAPQGQMPPPLSEHMMNPQPFNSQQSPMSQHFSVGPSPIQNMANPLQQTTQAMPNSMPDSFGGNPFDPGDPLQYNFDPASFNFGNHYGALEFGMLGHMSSGAAETPPAEAPGQLNQSSGASYTTPGTSISTAYSGSPANGTSYVFPQDQGVGEWRNEGQPNIRPGSGPGVYNVTGRGQDPNGFGKQEGPHAYAIGAGASTFTSPSSTQSPQDILPGFNDSPTTSNLYTASRQSMQDRSTQQRPGSSMVSSSNLQGQILTTARRSRNPSTIYESVKQPYPYTSAFHGLTAFLQKRFSPQKTLRIAKALASIRPSFISSTKDLNREDLIFMEKCFQRTLWEYEDFINACGTPTIVCRRTGEVAAVGKEFSILTGWKKDILLGREPNLNVNTGGTSGNPGTGASSRGGFNTPRIPEGKSEITDGSRPQPVYLAELLDDESAVEFYEDFSRLAFGDSRGSVTTQCKLLKYRAVNQPPFAGADAEDNFDTEIGTRLKHKRPGQKNGKHGIGGENGVYHLGGKDGKVECTYCWTVKRDVFDIPMLIVMNVGDRSTTILFGFLLIHTVFALYMISQISIYMLAARIAW